MATFDRTAADNLLKKRYEGPVRNQLNQASAFVAQLEKDYSSFDGLEIVIPIQTGADEGVGARAEGGTLPTARNATYAQSRFGVKNLFGRIELSLPLMETMKTNEGSFVRALDAKNKSMTETFKEDKARQVIRNDATGKGVLAIAGTTAGSTTVDLSSETIIEGRTLRVGMYIDIVDNDDNTVVASERKIVSITSSAGVPSAIVIDGAPVTTDTTMRIVRTGNWTNELTGLEGIIDDADDNLQNVDTGDNPIWKANVRSASSGPLSEDLLQQLLDDIDVAAGEQDIMFLCEYTQRRKFNALLQSQKRAVNTLELKGGYKALTFNDNIPFVVDKFVASTKIFAVNKKHLKFYAAADYKWADNDGAVLSRVANKAAFEAFMYSMCQLATDRRNAHGVLESLSA